MRQERVRKARFAPISDEVQDCTHLDLYEAAQQEIAEHHAACADNYYRQREIDDEIHRQAIENGANSLE